MITLIQIRGLDVSGAFNRRSGTHHRLAMALSKMPSAIVSGYIRSGAEVLLRTGDSVEELERARRQVLAVAYETPDLGCAEFETEIIVDPAVFGWAYNPLIEIAARRALEGHQCGDPDGSPECQCAMRGAEYADRKRMILGAFAGPLYPIS